MRNLSSTHCEEVQSTPWFPRVNSGRMIPLFATGTSGEGVDVACVSLIGRNFCNAMQAASVELSMSFLMKSSSKSIYQAKENPTSHAVS